jgi:endonuclease/exonuclease/phosphatase family metal-dependent hydrolase
MWERHYREIERQREQWRELRGQYPGTPMVVAGDFDQDRDGSGWYGTHRGRDLLNEALEAADLACVTAQDVVAMGNLADSHLVDHIAIDRAWADRSPVRLHCWEKTDQDGAHLSDHPTVAVDLVPHAAGLATPTGGETTAQTDL